MMSIEGLTGWLSRAHSLYKHGVDPMELPEKEKLHPPSVHWEMALSFVDMDEDQHISIAEASILGMASLVDWVDINDDGLMSGEEWSQVFQYVMEDAQKGRKVCSGIEVITATSGKLDVRMPLDADASCGWLIMPKWFYAPKKSLEATSNEGYVRKQMKNLPHTATALLRRHAHSRRFLATASSVNFSRVQAARSQTDHGSPFSRGPRRRLLQMDCAAGEVRNVDSDTCMQCPVGQFSSAGDTICSDCAPGKCKCQQRARVSGIERHERADNGLCAGFGCQVVVSLIEEWTKALRGCKAESLPECQ